MGKSLRLKKMFRKLYRKKVVAFAVIALFFVSMFLGLEHFAPPVKASINDSIVASYLTTSTSYVLNNLYPSNTSYTSSEGESFLTPSGASYNLTGALFTMKQSSNPNLLLQAQLYTVNGSNGINNTPPNNTPIAVSDTMNSSLFTTGLLNYLFNFSGANSVTLAPNTEYGITVTAVGGTFVTSSSVSIAANNAGSYSQGNYFYNSGGWKNITSRDESFEIFGLTDSPQFGSTTESNLSDLQNDTVTTAWSDAGNSLSGYIFGCDSSGTFTNSSYQAFNDSNSYGVCTNPVSGNCNFQVWAENSVGIWNTTGLQSFAINNVDQQSINWSGYSWNFKTGENRGPNSNSWSNSPQNIWVDSQGNLHLKMTYLNGHWYSEELDNNQSLSYGTYTWVSAFSPNLSNNVVLGMFSYFDDNNEVDVEYRNWTASNVNTDVGVEPLTANYDYFNSTMTGNYLVNRYIWSPSNVTFDVYQADGTLLQSYVSSYVPQGTTTMTPMVNLWLAGSAPHAPVNGTSQEVVINSFTYTPLLTQSPIFTAPTVSSMLASALTTVTSTWADNDTVGLGMSNYICGTNASGTFVNSTLTPFTSSAASVSFSNPSFGNVQYEIWAENFEGEWSNTGLQNYTVQFTITASSDENGFVSPSGDVLVVCGGNQTFTMAPGSMSQILNVVVDGVSVGIVNAYTFLNVTSNHSITLVDSPPPVFDNRPASTVSISPVPSSQDDPQPFYDGISRTS